MAAHDLDREACEHGGQHRPSHSVRTVDDDLERSQPCRVDEPEDTLDVGGTDVVWGRLRNPACGPESGLRAGADLVETGVASDRQRAAADDLHPRVLLGVVRSGDADPPVEAELADGVVEHLGPDQAEVEHLGAAVGCAVDGRLRHPRRRQAHVAPDRDAVRREFLDIRAPDRVGARLVELVGVDPAHVVRLEDFGVQHCCDSTRHGRQPWLSDMMRIACGGIGGERISLRTALRRGGAGIDDGDPHGRGLDSQCSFGARQSASKMLRDKRRASLAHHSASRNRT